MSYPALVRVGAVGWAHPEWRGRFYPEDLPDDWMLSYYNTQFQAVYLPAAVWQAASAATWARWLDDTLDGFCFLLEPGGGEHAQPVSERVLLATPAWAAEHVWWLDVRPDLRALAARITQQAATGAPLFVLSSSGDLGRMDEAKTLAQVMGY
ncbi:DUF72 domain-containing protein [Thiobacillus sedimenti]|uniref:DUF72 domain-containing protein n=1 Tax=Thiobacillus sedimenti TaxID=3110231 RepID=A0ABZ1CGB8_9PROT|nr:hypothetical protein [Thiobacillus sp. SCUT-2]WRS38428.1 hypothetical protein VA613_10475 [Thiobacillus sp. SCUT-2]